MSAFHPPSLTIGENGQIYANTLGDDTWDGNTLKDGRAGNIILDAEHLRVADGGRIAAESKCAGQGGYVRIETERLEMGNDASISVSSKYINTYTANNISELDTILIRKGEIANVVNGYDGEPEIFMATEKGWIRLQDDQVIIDDFPTVHTVSDIQELHALHILKTGDVVRVGDVGEENFVYTEKGWIRFNDYHTVTNIEERDALPAQTGDIVNVADAGNAFDGQSTSFIYSNGEWTTSFQSGNAGKITIHATDSVRLREKSFISTLTNGEGNANDIELESTMPCRISKICRIHIKKRLIASH